MGPCVVPRIKLGSASSKKSTLIPISLFSLRVRDQRLQSRVKLLPLKKNVHKAYDINSDTHHKKKKKKELSVLVGMWGRKELSFTIGENVG